MSFTIIHKTNEPFTKSTPTEYFPFKYQLDNFQLHGCKAIEDNENVLITAHTGSGKTALALYAIGKCLAQGKKVIYTSPIKTLSNQKFKEFSESFPDVGILTGDVKINPTAKCLILTAEILRNSLLQKRDEEVYDWNFNPDDVACVILDEVHFINNKERGKVWEEIIINLSPNIQLVMLSATISGANEMVDWIGNLKKVNCHLISTAKRPVPLTHSIYWDDELYTYEENETWIHDSWKNIKKDIDKYYSKNRHTSYTFHKCLEYLRNKDLLPVTVFLLNRDAVEKQAKSLTVFVEDHMANAEIKRIWDKNLLKYRDIYQHTEQWNTVFDLVCKGVGIHHSGMIPVLKEIVEILYNQGLIKVLLATETFALGVNSPTKTVIFTNLTKFDGTQRRLLRPEEYGQMAGRAGRRGLDTFGNVIVLPFPDFITESEAKEIIKAPPQKISSKLSLDYSIILKLLNYKLEKKDCSDPIEYIFNILSKTLFNGQEEKINSGILREKNQLVDKMELFMNTIGKSVEEYKDKFTELVEIKNKLKPNGFIRLDKKVEKKLLQQKSTLEMDIPSSIMKTMEHWYELDQTLKQINREVEFNENKLKYHIEDMLSYLLKNEMIDESTQLTAKGRVVSEVNECNPLILGKIINSNILDDLEFNQIVSLLSIFVADRSRSDDIYISDLDATEKEKDALKMILQWKDELEKDEATLMNNIPFTFSSEWTTSLSMYEATKHWCNGNTWLEMKDTFDNFEGNFIKNIIRLGNLVRNILSIAKILNNVKLINKLDGYQEKLIRDIVITDSLYI